MTLREAERKEHGETKTDAQPAKLNVLVIDDDPIALTANAFDEDVQHSMKAGLNAHLSKPVNPDILFETLENLINKHQ